MIETRKAHEGDLVELTEDLPKYGLRRGQRGFVIEAFGEPDEAYDLEFEDEDGEFLGFAYSVKPDQVINIHAIAGNAFEYGLTLLGEGKPFEAERELRRAIELKPEFIVNLHNWVFSIFENTKEWENFIQALRLVLKLDPNFEVEGHRMSDFARNNLATAYQNYAAQKATDGEVETALLYFGHAMGIASRPEIISLIQRNLAKAYTSLGIRAAESDDYEGAVARMIHACELDPNDMTRKNLGIAYAQAAKHYLDRQDYVSAVPAFEHAMDMGLLFPELLIDYGVALAKSGHQGEAVLALQRARKLSPNDQIIEHNLRLMERGEKPDFSTVEIKVGFPPVPQMQQQDYLRAA